jgi:hypothetical protein
MGYAEAATSVAFMRARWREDCADDALLSTILFRSVPDSDLSAEGFPLVHRRILISWNRVPA